MNGLLQSNATPIYTNIPEGTYVKRIVSNTQVELGVKGSRLTEGNIVNALQTSSTTDLYLVYANGIWADTLPNTVTVGPENEGPDVIQDTLTSPSYRECSGTADAIETLVGNITTIINSGLGTALDKNRQSTQHYLHPELQYLQLTQVVTHLIHISLKLVHQSDLYHAHVLML